MMGNYISIVDRLPVIDSDCEFYPTELYYDRSINKMIDCDGTIVFDIFRHITPSQLYLFKETGEDIVVFGNHGHPIGLIHEEGDDFFYNLDIDVLYYDEDKNVMTDDDGFIVHDIYKIITPNQLYLFKAKKQSMLVTGKNGLVVELIYSYDDELIDYTT